MVLDMENKGGMHNQCRGISFLATGSISGSMSVSQFRGIQPNFRQFKNQFRRPTIDIMLPNDAAHALHALLPFLRWHLKRLPDHLCHLSNVIWIDHQGVSQFAAGSGELAENEDAILVSSRDDKLLGHQIHAVVQGSHQTKIRGLVKGLDFAVTVMPVKQNESASNFRSENGG